MPIWSLFSINASQIEVQKSEDTCAVTGCKPGQEYILLRIKGT